MQVFKERTDIQAEEIKEVKRLLESDVAKWTSAATERDQLERRIAGIELQQKEIEKVTGEDRRLGTETQERNAAKEAREEEYRHELKKQLEDTQRQVKILEEAHQNVMERMELWEMSSLFPSEQRSSKRRCVRAAEVSSKAVTQTATPTKKRKWRQSTRDELATLCIKQTPEWALSRMLFPLVVRTTPYGGTRSVTCGSPQPLTIRVQLS